MPGVVANILDWFLEPGLTVWWFTAGGFFEGFPSGTSSIAIVFAANVVLWLSFLLVAFVMVRHASRRLPRRK